MQSDWSHVDDFFWAGSQNFSTDVIPNVEREEHEHFCHVGMDFVTLNGVVHVHEHSYIEHLQPIRLQAARAVQGGSETEKEQLRSKMGQPGLPLPNSHLERTATPVIVGVLSAWPTVFAQLQLTLPPLSTHLILTCPPFS